MWTIVLEATSRKARLWRASLLQRPHNGTSTTATRRRSGKARVCDDSVLPSSGSMHAYALSRTKQECWWDVPKEHSLICAALHVVGCRRDALRSNLVQSCPCPHCCMWFWRWSELQFPLALVADRLIFPITSVAAYLVGMCVPNPSLANVFNEKRSPWRILALLLCTCIAHSWFPSAVAMIQSLNLGGISHHGWQHTEWLRYPRKWPLSGSSFPFFSVPELNVAVFAIPLFRTKVGRSADERRWLNAQRKPLNAAKNTERSQECGMH